MGAFILASGTADTMDRLLGFDAQWLFDSALTGINILIMFAFLSYLLFNPVTAFLKKRQNKIKSDLETAVQDKEDAKLLKADYESRMKEIDKEAEEILRKAHKQAVRRESEMVEDAKAEAGRIIARANAEIVLERKKALEEMKQEIIAVAALMAGKVVSASIDTTIQDTLIDETLKEMGDHTWQS